MRIYTIGYGNLGFEELLELLKKHRIEIVVDVRRSPYSRNRKSYRKAELEKRLPTHGLKYTFMGDSLGGLIQDDSYYDPDGRPLWDKLRTREEFRRGIADLTALLQDHGRTTLLCAEAEPSRCHRAHLVGEELYERKIEVIHLLHNGASVSHDALPDSCEPEQTDLFD